MTTVPTPPIVSDAQGPSPYATGLPRRLLYGSSALAQWIREGGTPDRPIAAHRLRLWWYALWFEQNWRTQAPRLAAFPAPQDPVFVLGLWRSGTTVLHELLAACTDWVTPQTWQCFSPATCFLTSAPTDQSIAGRPMDRGHIATHGPQEDEFALLLLGEPSLYRGFLDPRRLRDCQRLDWTRQPQSPASAAALPRWQAFVRGIAAQSPPRRVLLKSPNHSFRLPLLRALYPGARFVWIGRHSGEILASNLKMWRIMTGLYGLWDCPPGMLEGFLQDALREAARMLTYCLDEMPLDSLLWIDFEELRADPRRTLERVLDFIGGSVAGPAQPRSGLDRALARVPIHPGNRADMPDTREVRRLEEIMAAARKRFNGLLRPRTAAVAHPGSTG